MDKMVVSLLVVVIALPAAVRGGDCPRFRGPAGDGEFPETGLLKQWPAGRAEGGLDGQGARTGLFLGHGGERRRLRDRNGRPEAGVICSRSARTARPKWKTAYGPELDKRGPAVAGTRATPTIDGERAYLVTGLGKLVIFDVAKGQVLKTVDLLERFKAGQAKFGFAESVLVDGQKIVCTVGGTDASLVALDKNTGEVVWQTKGLSQGPGCCAPRIISYSGRRLIVTMLANAAVAVDPGTGEVVWQHEYPHRAGVQPNPPLYADGLVYVTSGMGAGGALLSLADNSPTAAPQWTDKTMDCQMQGTVLIDGCIYGTAQSGNKGLVCLDWKTGKVMWNAPAVGMGGGSRGRRDALRLCTGWEDVSGQAQRYGFRAGEPVRHFRGHQRALGPSDDCQRPALRPPR